MAAAKKRRRRRSTTSTVPASWADRLAARQAELLNGDGEAGLLNSSEDVRGIVRDIEIADALEQRESEFGDVWRRQAEDARKAARDEIRRHPRRGRPLKSSEERRIEDHERELSKARERAQHALDELGNIYDQLRDDLARLQTRAPLVKKQRKLARELLADLEAIAPKMTELVCLQDQVQAIVGSTSKFVVRSRECIDASALRPDRDGSFFQQLTHFMNGLQREFQRLEDDAVRRCGGLTESDEIAQERARRHQYRQAFDKASVAFRKTPKGRRAWDTYRATIAAFNEVEITVPPTQKYSGAKRQAQKALEVWNRAVCASAELEYDADTCPRID